jgi:hypothetical protein
MVRFAFGYRQSCICAWFEYDLDIEAMAGHFTRSLDDDPYLLAFRRP